MTIFRKVTISALALGLFVLALNFITTFVTAATAGLAVNSVFDNKNNKTYQAGSPNGAEPMNDLNTTAEEWKFEVESGSTFWWEANYQDLPTGASNPTKVVVTINYRPEQGWTGTFRAEYRSGSSLLSSVNLPVDSRNDPATGKGQRSVYLWDVSPVVQSVSTLASGKVRFINTSTNGKKVFVSYSITRADYGVTPPPPTPVPTSTPRPAATPTPTTPPPATPTPAPSATPTPRPTATPTPVPTDSFVFAAIGDFGVNNSNELNVSNLVKSWNPALIITLGDNNYEDGAASTIDANIGKYYREFIFPYTGSFGAGATTNRFWPSLGNHDWNLGNVNGHSNYFTLPNNERYYDFVRGPVHFFAIDSDGHEPDGTSSTSIQGRWLQNKLATSTAKWKIVYFHHPPYSSSSNHGSSTWMQWPFQQWGASAVLSGHDHTYERLERGGFPYFVNGLGGRSRYAFGSPLPESIVRYNSAHGAQRIEATDTSLTFTFYNTSGMPIDSFTLLQ